MAQKALSSHRLLLIPGLGADHRLFEPYQRPAFPRMEILPFQDWRPAESLADYAARLAATVDESNPYFLGGASLGGMLALEMARRLSPRAVFLIGSCRSGKAVIPVMRLVECATRPIPRPLVDLCRPAFTAAFGASLHGLSREQRRLVQRMQRETPIPRLRASARAIMQWPGCPDPAPPVHHIHGARDRIIPLSRVHPDEVVPDGGHMLSMTHPDRVNAYIAERMNRDAPARAQTRAH